MRDVSCVRVCKIHISLVIIPACNLACFVLYAAMLRCVQCDIRFAGYQKDHGRGGGAGVQRAGGQRAGGSGRLAAGGVQRGAGGSGGRGGRYTLYL